MKLGTEPERRLAHHLRNEILNYLEGCPDKIRSGQLTQAELALRVGKMLIWLAGTLDNGEPPMRCPVNVPAVSAFSLGEQFRVVGLELWEAKQADTSTITQLRNTLVCALARVDELESVKP